MCWGIISWIDLSAVEHLHTPFHGTFGLSSCSQLVDQGIFTPDVGLFLIRALGKGFTCGVSLKMVRRRRWIFYLRVFSSRIIKFSGVDPIQKCYHRYKRRQNGKWACGERADRNFPSDPTNSVPPSTEPPPSRHGIPPTFRQNFSVGSSQAPRIYPGPQAPGFCPVGTQLRGLGSSSVSHIRKPK
jgi:hypothetical protein